MDTNVLVSGMLTPFGICGEILRVLTSGHITLCVDARILCEYDEVIRRPHFQIASGMADAVMEFIENSAELHSSTPLETPLPDPDDNAFLEVALSANADCLITGNLKHFPARCRSGAQVLSPRDFLELFKKRGRK